MVDWWFYQEYKYYFDLYNISLNGTNWTLYMDEPSLFENLENVDLAMSFKSQIFITFAFTFNMVLSIVGNVIVIVVLLCEKTGRTDLNAFLIQLAVADLAIAIFCMPFTFPTIMYGHWIFGTAMCPTVIFIQQVSVIASIFTLTAVGVDRYFAVIYPLKVRVTTNRTKASIVIWLLAGSLATVQTAFVRVQEWRYDSEIFSFCSEFPQFEFAKCYEILMMLFTYAIPLGILCFTYTAVGIRLWGRKIPGNADRNRDHGQAKAKKKVIKMLVIIVLLFAVFWLPVHIFKIVNTFDPYLYHDVRYQATMRTINCFVLWFAMAHSFVNPLIYSILNDNFRNSLQSLWRRCYVHIHRNRESPFKARTPRLSSQGSLSATRKLSLSSVSFFGRVKRQSDKSVHLNVKEDVEHNIEL